MATYKINIESVEHGVLSCLHNGKDQHYCEAGDTVQLLWQPSAGWGLQEAHYTKSDDSVTAIDLTPTVVNGKKVVTFTMPNDNISVGGTFKRFVIEDWTGGADIEALKGKALTFDKEGNLAEYPMPLFARLVLESHPQEEDVIPPSAFKISEDMTVKDLFDTIRSGQRYVIMEIYLGNYHAAVVTLDGYVTDHDIGIHIVAGSIDNSTAGGVSIYMSLVMDPQDPLQEVVVDEVAINEA